MSKKQGKRNRQMCTRVSKKKEREEPRKNRIPDVNDWERKWRNMKVKKKNGKEQKGFDMRRKRDGR